MGVNSSAGKPLQLRFVISSTEGTCSAPAVTSNSPTGARDNAGATTYELAKALGTITPISVALPKDQGLAHSVTLELNKADAGTLDDVSREAVDKHLAIVLDDRILSAPLVNEPLTTSMLTPALGTSTEAEHVAAELTASKKP